MKNEEIKRLFQQHYSKMYRVARTILLDEHESKDVVSDVFERLLSGNTVLLPATEERYLLTSVRNQCIKRLHHEEVKRLAAESYSKEQDDTEDDERLGEVIDFARQSLSVQEQRIFDLRFNQGCSYEEIAIAEGISKVAVWKHLSHLITIIKEHFNSSK